MACELELDNVARLANVISQRVEKMVKPSAWPKLPLQRAGEGLEWLSIRLAGKLGVEGLADGLSMSIDNA